MIYPNTSTKNIWKQLCKKRKVEKILTKILIFYSCAILSSFKKLEDKGRTNPKQVYILGKAPIRASQPCWLFLNNDNKVSIRNKEQMNHTLFPFHFSPNKPLMPQLNFSWKRHQTYLSSKQQSTSQKKNAIYKALMRYQTHIPFLITRLKSETGKKSNAEEKHTHLYPNETNHRSPNLIQSNMQTVWERFEVL